MQENINHIFVSGPSISQKEIDYVTDAVRNAWYGNANIYNQKFENSFAEYIGTKYAIALPSCTSALHISLLALDIKPGDEVIVPEITWIATAAPIVYVGAIPVFADIDERSWCLSEESFEKNITKKTKAVIPVDLYGNMPDMDSIRSIADKHGIAIVEDAAEAIGSEYKERKAGSFGDTGVFSFHGSKTMTTGEGGMLVTNNNNIYKRCIFLRDHGRNNEKMFWNDEIAYKYKMSSLQAALGLAQLERIEELVNRKREIFSWYKEELFDVHGITLNYEAPPIRNSYWMVTILWDKEHGLGKEDVIKLLGSSGIDTRPFFHPLSSLPAFESFVDNRDYSKSNIISYNIADYGINLPSGMNMNREKVKFICDCIKEIFR